MCNGRALPDARALRDMSSARRYRQMALHMHALANRQTDPGVKARIEDCAAIYSQYAEELEHRAINFSDLLARALPSNRFGPLTELLIQLDRTLRRFKTRRDHRK